MKIRIVLSVMAFITLLLCLVSCGNKSTYKFMYSDDEISTISLVNVSVGDKVEQKKLTDINNIHGFLKDFRNVSCYTWWGDPIGLTEDCCVIRIDYQNGDYELIYWNGKAEYQQDRGFRNYRGYYIIL